MAPPADSRRAAREQRYPFVPACVPVPHCLRPRGFTSILTDLVSPLATFRRRSAAQTRLPIPDSCSLPCPLSSASCSALVHPGMMRSVSGADDERTDQERFRIGFHAGVRESSPPGAARSRAGGGYALGPADRR